MKGHNMGEPTQQRRVRLSDHFSIVVVCSTVIWLAFPTALPALGDIIIWPNVKIGGPDDPPANPQEDPPRWWRSGPNALFELNECCYENPRQNCAGVDCDYCLGFHQVGEPPQWVPRCDDDPKHQREPAIAVADWDPNTLLGVFMDFTEPARGSEGQYLMRPQIGFGVSRDGAQTWERIERDDPIDPEPCESPLTFVPAYAGSRKDLCHDLDWSGGGSDPGAAVGLDPGPPAARGFLYFAAGSVFDQSRPFLARLPLNLETLEPLALWETAVVPGADERADKPFVSSELDGPRVYVHWSAAAGPYPEPYSVLLSISCENGAEFFEQPPHGCAAYDPADPNAALGIRISHLDATSLGPPIPTWGSASTVDADGVAHFVWPIRDHLGEGTPQQLYHRSLHWTPGGPVFKPPLPAEEYDPQKPWCDGDPEDQCVWDTDPLCACETPIVHGQPGIDGPGFLQIFASDATAAINVAAVLNHPSIAADRSEPGNVCNFANNLYVAYAAAEPDKDFMDPEDPNSPCQPCCDPENPECPDYSDYKFVDSNIYVVRSRDGGRTWSEPVRIWTHDMPEFAFQTECTDPVCGENSFRRPLQFFSWIAVDKQGRVGVMWYDTYPDFTAIFDPNDPNIPPQLPTPCDGGTAYSVNFAYSLDGGVHWTYGWEISDEVTFAGVRMPPWETCDKDREFGEYGGLTATSNEADEGVFYPIWSDARQYTPGWREELAEEVPPNRVDIYTAKVVVTDPVYGMGDFDRDYDVDMDDFANFPACGGAPIAPECEILDMNRNNVIDNEDPYLFLQHCFTGPRTGGGESMGGAGGETRDASGGADPLGEMVEWCISGMPPEERSTLAETVRSAAALVDAAEATRMREFADAIDRRP
jgi:hypothetical protein